MSLIIRPVFGFGSYPDGRLRAGPFNFRQPGELNLALDRFDLRPGGPGDVGMVSMRNDGIYLSAQGAGVRGYLLDLEEMEAPSSDLDAFMLVAADPGVACRVSGHWSPGPDMDIISDAVAIHDGRRVSWTASRRIERSDGDGRVIAASRPRIIARRA